jgi:hypothetical protein
MRGRVPSNRSHSLAVALALLAGCDGHAPGAGQPDTGRPRPPRDARPEVDAYRPADATAPLDARPVEDATPALDGPSPRDATPVDAAPPPDATPDASLVDAQPDAAPPADAAPASPDAERPAPREAARWVAGSGVLRGARFTLTGTVGPAPQGAGPLEGARFHLRAGVLLGETPR